jgi:type II secretory pathway pseudopilin PulG
MERKTMAIVPGEATGVLGRRDEVLYIAGQANAFLQVLDAATLQTQQLFVVDNGLQTLARDPMTGLLYGAARSEPGIQVYEPQGMNRIATLIAPNEIIDLTLDGTRHRLYAIAPESKTVQIYSLGGRHAVNALEPVGEPKRVLLFGVR